MAAFRAGKIEQILCNDSLADWESELSRPLREVSSQQKKDKKKGL